MITETREVGTVHMQPAEFETEIAANRVAFERLRERIQREHAGQYVALARGKLIAVSPSYDDALAAVQCLEPTPECYFIFPVEDEPIFEVISDFRERC